MSRKTENDKPARKRPVSERYLMNAATFYLGRYASSAENLRRVLGRKVRRRNEENAPANAEQQSWIDATVDKCVTLGLVNDTEYARMRTFSMHRSGKSERMIRGYLRQKCVGPEEIDAAIRMLADEKGENTEIEAALAYARRRRFGPFRTREGDADKKQKELAAFARAGFSYSLARRIVDAVDPESIHEV